MARAVVGSRARAVALTLPLFAFLIVTFVLPMVMVLLTSIHEPRVAEALPRTIASLEDWNEVSMPGEESFRHLGEEISALYEKRRLGPPATLITRLRTGMRTKIFAAARTLAGQNPPSWKEAFIEIDGVWTDAETWRAIQRAGERLTSRHYVNAFDLERDEIGALVARPPEQRILVRMMGRTLGVSTVVTVVCLLLAYPLAYLIANSPPRWGRLVFLLVLVPFWTSLLARTASWLVLLQSQGIINDFLVAVGLVGDDGRLAMAYNMFGTLVAMVHVLLPFAILPIVATMRSVPTSLMRSAASLGATFWQAFARVYWPQTVRGVWTAGLFAFMLATGYYITPELIGGSSGQLMSNMIILHAQESLNWGLAAALSVIMLAMIAAAYVAYYRKVGFGRLRVY